MASQSRLRRGDVQQRPAEHLPAALDGLLLLTLLHHKGEDLREAPPQSQLAVKNPGLPRITVHGMSPHHAR